MLNREGLSEPKRTIVENDSHADPYTERTPHGKDSGETLPTKPLLTFRGSLNGEEIVVLKDDGCNTNVLSTVCVAQHRHVLDIRAEEIVISHSDKNSTRTAKEMVHNATIKIGDHTYASNWAIATSACHGTSNSIPRWTINMGHCKSAKFNFLVHQEKRTIQG